MKRLGDQLKAGKGVSETINIAECNQPVAANVTRIIKEKGYKQKAVAMKVGVTPQDFNSMINGRRLIKVSQVLLIAKALEVPVDELYVSGSG